MPAEDHAWCFGGQYEGTDRWSNDRSRSRTLHLLLGHLLVVVVHSSYIWRYESHWCALCVSLQFWDAGVLLGSRLRVRDSEDGLVLSSLSICGVRVLAARKRAVLKSRSRNIDRELPHAADSVFRSYLPEDRISRDVGRRGDGSRTTSDDVPQVTFFAIRTCCAFLLNCVCMFFRLSS